MTRELNFVYAGQILVIWFLTKDYTPDYAVIALLRVVVWFRILFYYFFILPLISIMKNY